MKLRELIDTLREEMRDFGKPPLVSDSMGRRFANRAQVDAARRARLLVDSTSANICDMTVAANESVIALDPRVISIRRAILAGSSRPLVKRTVRQMDEEHPGWQTSTNRSTPSIVVVDYSTTELFLYPTPKVDGTLFMTVTREPLRPMVKDSDVPELPERYHDGIVAGMKYLAYTSDDSDLFDDKKAARAQAEFTAEFGPPISAAVERWEFEHYDDVGER